MPSIPAAQPDPVAALADAMARGEVPAGQPAGVTAAAVAAPVNKLADRRLVRPLTLPSRGKFYRRNPTGEVRIAAMRMAEEKVYLGSGGNQEDKIDYIVESCLDSGGVPYREMLIGDRLYILIQLMSLTWGRNYPITVQCECGMKFGAVANLDQIGVTTAADTACEPFFVKLSGSGLEFGLRHLRGTDEVRLHALVAEAAKGVTDYMAAGDLSYIPRQALRVVLLNGAPPASLAEVEEVLRTVEGPDILEFRSTVESNWIGPRLEMATTCPKCGREEMSPIPFGPNFFRPITRR